MTDRRIPNLAYPPDNEALDAALANVLSNSEALIRKHSERRPIDFGSCPNRFACRGCGREDYLHFDERNGAFFLSKERCPECGENIRGQVDTMYWNWLVLKRKSLKKRATRLDIASVFCVFMSILLGSCPMVLVNFEFLRLESIPQFQATALLIGLGLLIWSQHLSRRAKATRLRRDRLRLHDYLASEFPLRE